MRKGRLSGVLENVFMAGPLKKDKKSWFAAFANFQVVNPSTYQATNAMSLNTKLGRDAHCQFSWAYMRISSPPLRVV